MGSSLPPAELAKRDSALFEKMKCIFSIAPVGKLEKSWECFTERWPLRHRTLSLCVRCSQCLAQLGLGTGRQARDAGLCVWWGASGVRAFCKPLWV